MDKYLPGAVDGSSYDKFPTVPLPPGHRLWRGAAVWERIGQEIELGARAIAVDAYPGVDMEDLTRVLAEQFPDAEIVDIEEAAAKPIGEIDAMIENNLTEDRVFGVLNHQTLEAFYDPDRLRLVAVALASSDRTTFVVGWGATLAPAHFDVIVLADMARWEIQQRQRAGAPNWRCANFDEDPIRKVKRGYFVEWRVADRHKRAIFDRVDYVLDTNVSVRDAKLITVETFAAGLAATVKRPFRVVPFFDPGVWGGQWMRDVCGLGDEPNYAWCFDCVPEENSILLEVNGESIELPALDLVFSHPRELLGEKTFARFGAEFPIRFDFLDTMGGGNLSLQVHPLTDYIQSTFGMHYTQDESYYILDAAEDAEVYLGLKTDVDPSAMEADLRNASRGEGTFDATRFVNTFPAKKHDHFSIPAGTVHCSGANSMVLEISATPYIFTFKMWDWGRVGLDGIPRPIHLDHAMRNIQWGRDSEWTSRNLAPEPVPVSSGPGWVEERTGLHELEFIEVRRHWFEGTVLHDTHGTVNVLNLVEGAEAVVESPSGEFEPFVVHYAETFIVPAQVGAYTIRPHGRSIGQRLGTVKASVRGTHA
ncbi:class I mannose-6-phosphate isomerase [Humibacter albus]|uniref:class I mannose-6-phosphate isomerase n=1 Tax=Humibacter albus TaxID=427754 RepID=UPI0003B34688|nr:class I mannose-6-phosphate isomerase [Humibacter albus]